MTQLPLGRSYLRRALQLLHTLVPLVRHTAPFTLLLGKSSHFFQKSVRSHPKQPRGPIITHTFSNLGSVCTAASRHFSPEIALKILAPDFFQVWKRFISPQYFCLSAHLRRMNERIFPKSRVGPSLSSLGAAGDDASRSCTLSDTSCCISTVFGFDSSPPLFSIANLSGTYHCSPSRRSLHEQVPHKPAYIANHRDARINFSRPHCPSPQPLSTGSVGPPLTCPPEVPEERQLQFCGFGTLGVGPQVSLQ